MPTTTRAPIAADKAPAAIGPYSQAMATDTLLFTSGAIPLDPQTGTIPEGNIEDHAHLVFRNLSAIAEAAGTSLDKAVKVTIFLTDISHFQRVNAVYAHYFSEPYPARSAVQVAALPLGASIEVEAVIAL
ncbi:MAG: RidA family protein [Desulfobulbus sp.]|jgi:2-iminobutanoate/2-iminopropanoate deaminase|uniref:RidA family protein n=1 Tax=Desulfobulbus sp. TaxID=895 RepID=UPI002845C6BF|nr:RidA family protein [Desulfobulbus sp.]MDR2548763.1 RidA family protein [Desulfobulbus sp.]